MDFKKMSTKELKEKAIEFGANKEDVVGLEEGDEKEFREVLINFLKENMPKPQEGGNSSKSNKRAFDNLTKNELIQIVMELDRQVEILNSKLSRRPTGLPRGMSK